MRYYIAILFFILPGFSFAQPAAGTRQIDSINAFQITAGAATAGQIMGYDGSIWKAVASGGYTLPIASEIILGGVKIASGGHLAINSMTGALSVVADIYESSVSIIASGNTFVSAAKTGHVTSPQNSNVMTIANGVITDAMFVNMTAHSFKANATGSAATPTNVVVNASSFVGRGSTGSIANLTSADLTFSGATFVIANNAINTAKIANSAVTLAKIQNVSQGQFPGRYSSGTGVLQTMSFNPSHFSVNSGTGVVSAIGGGGGDNLFTADLTLAANRTHNLAGFNWLFDGGGSTVYFGAYNPLTEFGAGAESIELEASVGDVTQRIRVRGGGGNLMITAEEDGVGSSEIRLGNDGFLDVEASELISFQTPQINVDYLGGSGLANVFADGSGNLVRGASTIVNTTYNTAQTSTTLNGDYGWTNVGSIIIAPNVGAGGTMYIKRTASLWSSSTLTGI